MKTPSPTARYELGMAQATKSQLYIFGGKDLSNTFTGFDVYDFLGTENILIN